jgi:hypothetical protein
MILLDCCKHWYAMGVLGILLFTAPAVWVGCGGPREDKVPAAGDRQDPSLFVPAVSERALGRALVAGMPTNELMELLGTPQRTRRLPSGAEEWRISVNPFPATDDPVRTTVVGLVLTITNGHLARWDSIYLFSPDPPSRRVVVHSSAGEGLFQGEDPPLLGLFLVSDDPLPDGRSLAAHFASESGFLRHSPDLASRAYEELWLEPAAFLSDPDVWTVNVVFDEATASELQRMTANNVSGRVVVAIGDELLTVCRIVAPIAGGSLSFQCPAHRLQKVLGIREDKGTGF